MTKKLFSIFLCTIMVISMVFTVVHSEEFYYDDKWNTHNENIKLYFENDYVQTDVPSLILESRTLVPVRAFFEKLGADVSWNEKNKEVIISSDDYEILLGIDSYVAYINNKSSILDVPAKIITDANNIARTLVPVRFISESLGYKVAWDEKTYSVHVSTPAEKEVINSVTATKNGDSDIIEIITSASAKPVVTKISNPERLILDFYDFELMSGDGSLGKPGNSITNVRYANHDNYARVVVDVSCEYTYDLKISGNVCTVTLKGESIQSTPTPTLPPTQTTPSPSPSIAPDLPEVETAGNGLVVIDPGHGGSDPGAIGYKNGEIYITESFANLDISLRLYDILKSHGVNVAMTRTTDTFVGLRERAEYANNLDASLFICVHNNSATTPAAHGSMVYYYTGSTDAETEKLYGITSKALATLIHEGIINRGGRYDRKIADGSKFVVLYSTNMPAILAECAFISNDEERELLNTEEFRQKLAEGIADGVLKALKQIGKL